MIRRHLSVFVIAILFGLSAYMAMLGLNAVITEIGL